MMATLLGMPSSICCSIFRRLIRFSSQLSWCDTRARRMVLRLVPLATLLCRSLSGRRSASKPDVAGALRTRHNPASQRLRRSSISRIGDAAAREAASCKQSFFGKRSTDGAIVAKRRSVRFTYSTSRKPRVRHAVLRQE